MPKLIVPLILVMSGCASQTYNTQPQQQQDMSQTTNNIVRVNNSLAEVISSSYPLMYAISVLAH